MPVLRKQFTTFACTPVALHPLQAGADGLNFHSFGCATYSAMFFPQVRAENDHFCTYKWSMRAFIRAGWGLYSIVWHWHSK